MVCNSFDYRSTRFRQAEECLEDADKCEQHSPYTHFLKYKISLLQDHSPSGNKQICLNAPNLISYNN